MEFTISNVIAGERVGYCKAAVLYDEQPVKFIHSWHQRMRWAKGYLLVFRKYGKTLSGGMFHGRFACYDMCMAIMPAIVLTTIGIIANSASAVLGILAGQNVWIAMQSAGEAFLNAYLFLLAIGGITTITQWRQIRTTTAKKVLYAMTFPVFMMTYIPISFVALFKKVERKPIEHKVSVSIHELIK